MVLDFLLGLNYIAGRSFTRCIVQVMTLIQTFEVIFPLYSENVHDSRQVVH